MRRLINWFRQPSAINAAQCAAYAVAGFCGFMAAFGALPNIVTAQIGVVLSVFVGSLLVVGGFIGAVSVSIGHWWLEQVALWITGVGYFTLIIPCVYYAFRSAQNPTIWLVVALCFVALIDVFKRYRRIDWAYLDPAK